MLEPSKMNIHPHKWRLFSRWERSHWQDVQKTLKSNSRLGTENPTTMEARKPVGYVDGFTLALPRIKLVWLAGFTGVVSHLQLGGAPQRTSWVDDDDHQKIREAPWRTILGGITEIQQLVPLSSVIPIKYKWFKNLPENCVGNTTFDLLGSNLWTRNTNWA